MANNKTEAISAVNTKMIPEIEAPELRDILNNDMISNMVFDKDVIGSQSPSGGIITVDFSNKDTATVTTSVSLAVSFSGLENGAVKHLVITKQAANAITFSGAIDVVQNRDYINTLLTLVCYRISNKNGVIYVEGLFAPVSNPWITIPSVAANWPGNISYRKNLFTNKIEVIINVANTDGNGTSNLATLPSGYWPTIDYYDGMFPDISTAPANGVTRMTDFKISNLSGIISIRSYNVTQGWTYYKQLDFYQ